jgi:hypothetical protein
LVVPHRRAFNPNQRLMSLVLRTEYNMRLFDQLAQQFTMNKMKYIYKPDKKIGRFETTLRNE